jgi:NAD(P)H-dependent flavin oxidoreductase YrpB (nitropropane dioxygenase family)
MPGRAIFNEFLEKVKQGKKQPIKCPFQCIKTCEVSSSPYCIITALINAVKGNFNSGYAFAGSNAFKATTITSVKDTITKLIKEYKEKKAGE